MNRRQKTGIEVGADHIYYNIAVQNDQTTPINLQFQDIRTVELVKNPEEYYLSVVRFFVPGAGIPLFHIDPVTVVVNITSGNPVITSANLFNPLMVGFTVTDSAGLIPAGTTIINYINPDSVTLSVTPTLGSGTTTMTLVNATYNVASLVFNNNTYSAYVPFTQTSNYDTLSVNSYQEFLDMVNAGYSTAYASLVGATGGQLTQYPPKFYWDPQTWLISMYVDNAYAIAGQPQIYMNFDLFSYFQGFKNYQYGYGLSTFLDNNIIVDNSALYVPNPPTSFELPYQIIKDGLTGATGTNYLKVTQDWTSFHVWPSIESVVFTSSLAPVRKEFIPSNNQSGNEAQANNNTSPVLSDFVVPTEISPGACKGNLEYLPTAEYRLIDFISNVGFSEFNIKAFWQDNHSNLFPIILEPNDYASIKFLFRKKTFKSGKSYGE
jgi:hypothetical protein